MDKSKIYLHVERDGDSYVIADQDGRKLQMIRAINVSMSMDDPVEVTVTFLESSSSICGPIISKVSC